MSCCVLTDVVRTVECDLLLCCEMMQIYAPTGPVTRDFDDVRRYQEAAEKGLKRLHIDRWTLFDGYR